MVFLLSLAHSFQFFQHILKILGQFRKDHHRPAIPGMAETQGTGMKALAVLTQFRFLSSVNQIAQNGVPNVGHVNTDLMGPSGFQLAGGVGVTPVAAHHFPVGHGVFGIALGDSHFLPVGGVPSDGGIHSAGVFPEGAADDGFVGPGHGVVLQLACQHHMGQIVFGNRKKPGSILVDPVDDAGPQLAVDSA